MPNLIERVAARLGLVKAAQTQSSYGRGPYARIRVTDAVLGADPRRGAKMLRNWSRTNEWVRTAIDYRREQIAKANWKIVRLDDPKAPPNPAIEQAVRTLFAFVNNRGTSFRWLLNMVIEDLLVLDAGCVEKEKTLGGDIVALYEVDGATIVPDPDWDGTAQEAPRYFQYIDGTLRAKLRNDQLIYMQRTPTTYSPIGWSPVETLMRAIEADLYGEQYDYEMLKQTAPSGLLFIGAGITSDQVESFREYYESEIAGTKDITIFGGGEPGANGRPEFIPFHRSNREQERQAYKEWLVKKIATVFRIDKSLFNITESVNRATSKTQQSRTDEGLQALADDIQEFITREIVWEIDPSHKHGFSFDELTDRDEAAQAQIDTQYVASGIWTINEIRAKQGLDPVEWGDNPWIPMAGPLPAEPPEAPPDPDDETDPPQNGEHEDEEGDAAKRAAPFVPKRRLTSDGKHSYLSIS